MDGFQTVNKSQYSTRIGTPMRTLTPSIETLVVNSFNALLDAEVEPEMEAGGRQNPHG